MSVRVTEQLHHKAQGLDTLPCLEVAALLVDSQIVASQVVRSGLTEMCKASELMAQTIRSSGVLHYVGAGSSGLMAASDALELSGSFSIPSQQVRIHMAGGMPQDSEMLGHSEDGDDLLPQELGCTRIDSVIVVSASGATVYAVRAAEIARSAGATVIGIANNEHCPLFSHCDLHITLPTPPEIISGSTRLGSGTAQKIALNTISTLMAIHLGHIYDGRMVNVRADNIKLRTRAETMIADIADVAPNVAKQALEASSGNVKEAILLAAGSISVESARQLLFDVDGHLRIALTHTKQSQPNIS